MDHDLQRTMGLRGTRMEDYSHLAFSEDGEVSADRVMSCDGWMQLQAQQQLGACANTELAACFI